MDMSTVYVYVVHHDEISFSDLLQIVNEFS